MEITWEELRKELELTPEDEAAIELEKELIRDMIEVREKQGLTQSQLAEKCNIKQSAVARMESGTHSPRLNSLLKILTSLGCKLKIVPIEKN